MAQYFPPDLGGSATRAYNVAKGLSLNGVNVTVVAAFPHYPLGNIPAEYRWTPLKVEHMGKVKVMRTFIPGLKSEGFFKRLMLMASFALSSLFALPFVGKIDFVWASSWVPGWVYSRAKRTPLALNVDDLTIEDMVDLKLIDKNAMVLKIAMIVYNLFYAKGDVVTPVSSGYFRILNERYHVDQSRIHLIRGGVDLSIFKPNTHRRKYENKFVVLYSGAFSVAYDFEQIFKAAKIVEEIDEGVEFVIQGAGELLRSMHDSLSRFRVKNVKIINKILSRSEVAELLAQADVLILPLATFCKLGEPYRGMSSKLYEYQAVGKPIVSCSRGVPSDYVKATNSGLVVEPGDAEALAKAVLKLKHDPSLMRIMGENGRKYVENEASIEAVGLKMKKILEMLSTET